MKKMNREEFRKYSEKLIGRAGADETANDRILIKIAKGTCGNAAGALETEKAFRMEIDSQNITQVDIKSTGCMGLCSVEPTVEVRVPGMPPVIYGRVDGEAAVKIVKKHILGRLLINDYIFDFPAADFIGGKRGDA